MAGLFTYDMKIGQVKGCRDKSDRFTGLQITLVDSDNSKLVLSALGDVSSSFLRCDTLPIRYDDYIKTVRVGWDSHGISSMTMSTAKGIISFFGTKQTSSNSFNFQEETSFIGFYGRFGMKGIGELGVIVYKPSCGLRAKEAYEAALTNDEVPYTVPDSSEVDIDAQFEKFESPEDKNESGKMPIVDDEFYDDDEYDSLGIFDEDRQGQAEGTDKLIPILVISTVAVLIFVICIICIKLAKRKRIVVLDEETSLQEKHAMEQ